jgi:chromosome segregation ATPase
MRHVTTVLLIAALASGAVFAQSARKDGGNNAQLMQQMQQLAAERTQLSADNAKLKKEVDEARKERDALKAERDGFDRKVRGAEGAALRAAGDRKQLEDELAQYKTRMTELVDKFRDTVSALREVETDRATAKRDLETRSVELKSCVDRNVQLYTLNDEVLKQLEGQGVFSGLARAEPFTRIKRTQLENLADDYRARAEDAHIEPAPPPASAPPTAANPGG